MNDYIVLLDPSVKPAHKNATFNIGDTIIFDAVYKILNTIFPQLAIERISTHTAFGAKEKKIINNAQFTFVGGTNILTSDIRHFSRLTPEKKNFSTFFRVLKMLFY